MAGEDNEVSSRVADTAPLSAVEGRLAVRVEELVAAVAGSLVPYQESERALSR